MQSAAQPILRLSVNLYCLTSNRICEYELTFFISKELTELISPLTHYSLHCLLILYEHFIRFTKDHLIDFSNSRK